jgi:cbb3-type cytochrome oxidase maturation protein
MMPLGLWVLIGWMILVPLTAIGFFIWGWKNGQFRDIEAAKYKMLEDKEPEPWPDQNGGTR